MTDPLEKPAITSADADLSGRQLGNYKLLRRLGRGAMAEVYLAEQASLGRRVAVKVLKSDLAADETYIRRFQREARAAAALVHANIVQIYEVGERDGIHFIAQEYVQGRTLHQWIQRNGPPDPESAVTVMYQVASALAKAAEAGIVHRDIKPENIMLTDDGEVKVADFGLARVIRKGEAADLTEVGVTMGTPLYMSPEQVEGRSLDPRSDIYSLGVTCYHMLAGVPPFRGETALSVAVKHLNTTPEPLSQVRPDLPETLCGIVHKMLAKRPADRHQSAEELLDELGQIPVESLEGGTAGGEAARWTTPGAAAFRTRRFEATQRLAALMATTPLSRPRWRYRLLAVVAALVVLAAGALFAYRFGTDVWLLDRDRIPPAPVPVEKTAMQQWLLATKQGTPEAWQAVVEQYGDTKFATDAKRQLALCYLDRRNDAKALALFDEFAAQGDKDERLRAFGLAGRAVVLTLRGDYGQSAAALEELWPLAEDLHNPGMERLKKVLEEYVIERNREVLGEEATQSWLDLLRQPPTPPENESPNRTRNPSPQSTTASPIRPDPAGPHPTA